MSGLKLLLHTCCAPCLIAPYQKLTESGTQVTAFWFNLNIHPYTEYKQRLESLREFSRSEAFELIERDVYGIDEFIRNTAADIENRCEYCYRHRLEATAITAKELGFEAFSSTLLYSRYQNHELIRSIADEMAKHYQISFYYEDFRELWTEGITLSKAKAMYRQKYCGCIFSERDRYLGKPQRTAI